MISVVIPFFNELASIGVVLDRTRATFRQIGIEDYELLVVDNGSAPDQGRALRDKLRDDPRARIIELSRNFGYQGALWAGLDAAEGDPVVFMDADGEDPPELIARFVAAWKEGHEVVYGIRDKREVSRFLNLCYRVFYRLLSRWSDIRIPLDAGEFSLVAGPALKAMRTFSDRTRMMRILRAWVGFRQVGVHYDREARVAGRSKFSFLSAVRFAWDGFVAATDIPVRLSIYCAMACFSAGSLGTVYYFLWYFFGRERIPGFASLNITILFLFSMLFACVAVLARYVITLLDETRRRPPYLVAREIRGDRIRQP
jgi:dolichol-phosphate mannosyltransferase